MESQRLRQDRRKSIVFSKHSVSVAITDGLSGLQQQACVWSAGNRYLTPAASRQGIRSHLRWTACQPGIRFFYIHEHGIISWL